MNHNAAQIARKFAPALAVLAVLAACSNNSQRSAPEPTPSNIVNGTNTHVIQMPDGFRNVAFTCYGQTGVYVTSRGVYNAGAQNATPLASSVFVIPHDEHCP